ncbi:unnamed protein product [Miscanthus lutarioriparius]|uniref:Uncharacterized protein n=1 Tax=Miscanthus lutarioriparius TaxID=422564 RepID=A0A811PYP5_9POAL|nr:unnamed protein product [Miscanthus lutarioriparius]
MAALPPSPPPGAARQPAPPGLDASRKPYHGRCRSRRPDAHHVRPHAPRPLLRSPHPYPLPSPHRWTRRFLGAALRPLHAAGPPASWRRCPAPSAPPPPRTSVSTPSARPHLLFLTRIIEASPPGTLLPPAESHCFVCPSIRVVPRPIVMPSASSIIKSSIKGHHVGSGSFGSVYDAISDCCNRSSRIIQVKPRKKVKFPICFNLANQEGCKLTDGVLYVGQCPECCRPITSVAKGFNEFMFLLACLRALPYEKRSPHGCTLLQGRCVHRMLDSAAFVGSNVFTPEIMDSYASSFPDVSRRIYPRLPKHEQEFRYS